MSSTKQLIRRVHVEMATREHKQGGNEEQLTSSEELYTRCGIFPIDWEIKWRVGEEAGNGSSRNNTNDAKLVLR